MANRFSRWAPTNYVALPTDMYQAALASKEQQGLADLERSKVYQDQLEAVQAVSKPGKALKDKHMTELRTQIEAIGKRNFGTQEALMELKRVIYDKNRLNDLYNISLEAKNYKKLSKESEAYTKEYGNDYNIDDFQSKWADYNKSSDPTTFNPKLLESTTINKYIPIVENLRKALGEFEKESGEEVVGQSDDGTWFTKNGRKGITSQELFKDAYAMLADPTYQSQLQTFSNYYARRNGEGDMAKGFEMIGKQHAQNNLLTMESQITADESKLAEDIKNKKELKLTDADIKKRQDEIADKKKEVNEVKRKLDNNEYTQDNYKAFSKQALLNTLISSAIAPLNHMVGTSEVPTLNPLVKAQLDYERDLAKMKYGAKLAVETNRQNKINDLTIEEEFANRAYFSIPISGTVTNIPVSDNDVDKELEKQFGKLGVKNGEIQLMRDDGILATAKDMAILPFELRDGKNDKNIIDFKLKQRTEAVKQLGDLIAFAAENDKATFKKFFPNGVTKALPNKQQEQYLGEVFKKIKSATKSNMANVHAFGLDKSQGFDEDEVKNSVMGSILQGGTKKVYKNGVEVKDFNLGSLFDTKGKTTRGLEEIIKNSKAAIRIDGKYSIAVNDKDGTVYNIVVDAPEKTAKFFASQNNLLNPSHDPKKTNNPGFAQGDLIVNGQAIPIVNQSKLNMKVPAANGEYEYQSHLFTPQFISIPQKGKPDTKIPLGYNATTGNLTTSNFYKSIAKQGPETVAWLDEKLKVIPANKVVRLDLDTKQEIDVDDPYDSGNVLTFTKDQAGNVSLLQAFNAPPEDIRSGIINTYRMINPQFKAKKEKK